MTSLPGDDVALGGGRPTSIVLPVAPKLIRTPSPVGLIPGVPLDTAIVPDASVPMKLPSTELPLVPVSAIWTPSVPFPEMMFP